MQTQIEPQRGDNIYKDSSIFNTQKASCYLFNKPFWLYLHLKISHINKCKTPIDLDIMKLQICKKTKHLNQTNNKHSCQKLNLQSQ